jgi:ABC-type transport system involved in cytochrome bd biosynthesis fused ATPase/permease subunit
VSLAGPWCFSLSHTIDQLVGCRKAGAGKTGIFTHIFSFTPAPAMLLKSPSNKEKTMAAYQYICTMYGNSAKPTATAKKVIENITLSFLPGVKIGVLGPNGSGKSTLLRIMAGRDKEFTGDFTARRWRTRRLPRTGAATR